MKLLRYILPLLISQATFSQKGLQVNSGYLKIYSGSIVDISGGDGNLTTGASGTIQNDGTIVTGGNWNNDGTLNANAGAIKCAGDFTSNGVQNESTSSVEFYGTSSQEVSGSDLTFHDVTINNTSGDVNLLDNASINGTITFTTGDLIIATAKSLSIDDSDDPGISGGSTASHIVTNGTATIEDIYSSMVQITYPLGNGTTYRPVSLSPSVATAETWTVSYTPTGHSDTDVDGSGLDHISSSEYWEINRSGSVDATLELTWTTSSVIDDYASLVLAHYDGTTDWNIIASTPVGDNTSGVITSTTPISTFSPFTLASTSANNPLPIELLSFHGQYNSTIDAVTLIWATASEINNDYFTVEKSINTRDWKAVSQIKGAGTSNTRSTYHFDDHNFEIGCVYYRLKQTDYDGTFKYSKSIAIQIQGIERSDDADFFFPNPTDRYVYFNIGKTGYIQIMDTKGFVIIERDLNEWNNKIDLLGYGTGIYFITATTPNGIYSKKLVLR